MTVLSDALSPNEKIIIFFRPLCRQVRKVFHFSASLFSFVYMDRPFQYWLMQEAKARAGHSQVLSQILKSLLEGSDSNVYKKMRGDIELRIEEALLIARHFGISLDAYAHQHAPQNALFVYPALGRNPQSPEDFLHYLSMETARISALPTPCVWYATSEVPLFHYMPHAYLTAFKLFFWSRINWALPAYAQGKFSPEGMYAAHSRLDHLRQQLASFYFQVPTREYWPPNMLDYTLGQISHYAAASFFEKPK
ncbi:MAG TPA: hypothetical protein PKD78_16515 [Saprospiraceae bacterium]|nr:hypothetical protein [Saprospiraceae bacterium]